MPRVNLTIKPIDEIPARQGGSNMTVLPFLQSFFESGVKKAEVEGMKGHSTATYNRVAKNNNLPVHLMQRQGVVYITRTDS